jgi:hypothetical protein
MSPNAFLGKAKKPTDEELTAALGPGDMGSIAD